MLKAYRSYYLVVFHPGINVFNKLPRLPGALKIRPVTLRYMVILVDLIKAVNYFKVTGSAELIPAG